MGLQADLYNMALMRIGVFNGVIQDPNEQSKEADLCNRFYDMVRKYVLRDFPWNFAETRVTLPSLGTPPQNWGYNYQLPSDLIKALYITLPGVRRPRTDIMPSWQIVGAQSHDAFGTTVYSRQLVTDMSPVELVYTADIQRLGAWDPMAFSALAYRLAAEVAIPMKASTQIAQFAMQAYYREASIACAHMMNEQTLDPEPDSQILAARGTASLGNWGV